MEVGPYQQRYEELQEYLRSIEVTKQEEGVGPAKGALLASAEEWNKAQLKRLNKIQRRLARLSADEKRGWLSGVSSAVSTVWSWFGGSSETEEPEVDKNEEMKRWRKLSDQIKARQERFNSLMAEEGYSDKTRGMLEKLNGIKAR